MGLAIRMLIYAASAGLAGYGFGVHDAAAGTLTIDLNQTAAIVGGVVAFAGTFVSSRIAKRNGGQT